MADRRIVLALEEFEDAADPLDTPTQPHPGPDASDAHPVPDPLDTPTQPHPGPDPLDTPTQPHPGPDALDGPAVPDASGDPPPPDPADRLTAAPPATARALRLRRPDGTS